jgi:1-acyl-sn-glycerol-3-phosphate acyltransferase
LDPFSPTGRLQALRPGIGLLLERVDVPVIPVWIQGTRAALPPPRRWPRPHPISVTFGEPVRSSQFAQAGAGPTAADRIRDALFRRLNDLAPPPSKHNPSAAPSPVTPVNASDLS